jgi:CHAD domain-containing protein
MESGAAANELAKRASGAKAMKWMLEKSAAENAGKRLPGLVTKYFHAGRKAVKGGRPPAKLHRFRVKTKQLRYALEMFQPIYGAPMELRLESLEKIQKLLGKVSDIYTARDLLEGEPGLKKELDREGKKKLDEFRDYWKDTFDASGEIKAWKQFLGRTG